MAWGPGDKCDGRVIEVYPAATRCAYGVVDKGGVLDGFGATLDCAAVDEDACSVDEADACVCVRPLISCWDAPCRPPISSSLE